MDMFLTAEWRKLVLVNYVVDEKILRPYLPAHTEIDFYDGKCFMSLVGFLFVNTKIRKYAIPFHKNFEEVNLRFYVRYRDGVSWKRGVVFIREFVPLPMVTLVANTLYDERYETVPMKHTITTTDTELSVSYQWRKSRWHSLSVRAKNVAQTIAEGSKEEFITQHFWGYAKRKRYTSEYEVAHEKWEVYPLSTYNVDVRFGTCYGNEFSFLDDLTPESVFFAEGSPVEVYRDRKIFGP